MDGFATCATLILLVAGVTIMITALVMPAIYVPRGRLGVVVTRQRKQGGGYALNRHCGKRQHQHESSDPGSHVREVYISAA